MKNFDSRTYSINDFVEWDEKKQLSLSPKFQRKAVWSENAKSYLMDTIVRGKPIPKVFIRQSINVETRQSLREVVDGQQRLRTILAYINDEFVISKKHNAKYGGYFFSQLNSIDNEIQANILNYELAVDLLVNLPDNEILDIFGRLNSYSVILNEQEKIHANHFGPYKILVDKISYKYNDFWIENKILNNQEVLRMADITLVADLVIAICDGIQSKKQIKAYYNKFENDFPFDPEEIEELFDYTIRLIFDVFGTEIRKTEFQRIHLFYTLFVTFNHLIKPIKNLSVPLHDFTDNIGQVKEYLTSLTRLFKNEKIKVLSEEEIQFIDDSRRATTDTKVRIRRSEFLIRNLNSLL